MLKPILAAVLLLAPTVASAMDVATFLAKADALQKKGAMAIFSSDLKLVMNEGKTAAGQLRAERLADVKAGRKPAFCPPEKSTMNSNEVMAHMRTIPAAQRGMSFKTALAGMMKKKYPCPA